MKCNFSLSWIHNFQNFLGSMPPKSPRGPKKEFYSQRLENFWGVRQISHSFLTLKLNRSGLANNTLLQISLGLPRYMIYDRLK